MTKTTKTISSKAAKMRGVAAELERQAAALRALADLEEGVAVRAPAKAKAKKAKPAKKAKRKSAAKPARKAKPAAKRAKKAAKKARPSAKAPLVSKREMDTLLGRNGRKRPLANGHAPAN